MLRAAQRALPAFVLVLAAAAQGAHAQAAPAPAADPATAARSRGEIKDPLEKLNRVSFLVGGALDIALVRPVSVFYAHAAPRPARSGLAHVVDNLGEPVVIVNRVLQLRPEAAARTLARFAVNSTFGLGGLLDPASRAGLPSDPTDFGATLGRYGVRSGPYLFVPVLGPTTVRGAVGRIADIFTDPFTYLRFTGVAYIQGGRPVVTGLDDRIAADPELKEIQRRATDPYAAIRSAYVQNAAFERNGGRISVKDLPDFGPEPVPTEPPSSPPSPK